MPKLLFEPKFHTIGDQKDIFVTSSKRKEPILCIRCNEMAKFILEQMYPDHTPRTEIIPKVMARFSISEEEATTAVNQVISTLKSKGAEPPNEF